MTSSGLSIAVFVIADPVLQLSACLSAVPPGLHMLHYLLLCYLSVLLPCALVSFLALENITFLRVKGVAEAPQ